MVFSFSFVIEGKSQADTDRFRAWNRNVVHDFGTLVREHIAVRLESLTYVTL